MGFSAAEYERRVVAWRLLKGLSILQSSRDCSLQINFPTFISGRLIENFSFSDDDVTLAGTPRIQTEQTENFPFCYLYLKLNLNQTQG